MKKVVVLTGAGISADSGVSTFRDSNGLWENHRIEEVATPVAFSNNPSLVYEFYNQRRSQQKETLPNKAHIALAELQNHPEYEVTLVTQNVDNLHERAGSARVLHMHGELCKKRCLSSGEVFEEAEAFDGTHLCKCCDAPSRMRPHIVWFGEIPFFMDQILRALRESDLFISIGTSGQVYPAAGFVEVAKREAKAYCVELNLDVSMQSEVFNESIKGRAKDIVPRYVQKLISAGI